MTILCHLFLSLQLSAGDVIGAGSLANSDRHIEGVQYRSVGNSNEAHEACRERSRAHGSASGEIGPLRNVVEHIRLL